jgi:ribonuclease Y
MVKPTEVDDDDGVSCPTRSRARSRIELEYPGQIKVTVIRESRATEFAK